MKNTVTIPKFFHELLGETQRRSELLIILIFTLVTTAAVALVTAPYWLTLQWYQALILWLLFLDISGGVVANLSAGTDAYYAERSTSRWVFIGIHVQPLILAFALQSPMTPAVLIWAYTILSAAFINAIRKRPEHRLVAGVLMALGVVGFLVSGVTLPAPISVLYVLFMIKVIYSFAVHHGQVK